MSSATSIAGTIAAAAVALPVLGFAGGPIFRRLPLMWQPVGPAGSFSDDAYRPVVIRLTSDSVGEVALSTVFVRRRNPVVDTEPLDRWNHVIAISSRCAHVGCPVDYVDAAQSFVCPCHGGVYDFRGLRVGAPPPRPLDRFFTRARHGQIEIGPRYSINSGPKRFSPRDPARLSTASGPWCTHRGRRRRSSRGDPPTLCRRCRRGTSRRRCTSSRPRSWTRCGRSRAPPSVK